LGFNWHSTLFSRSEVRQAVRQAIDLKRIEATTGLEPAKGPIPLGIEAYDSTLPNIDHDPAKAKAVLGGLKVKLVFNKNSYYGAELAECVRRDLDAAEVKLTLDEKLSSSLLLEDIATRKRNPDDHYLVIQNWYSILPAAEIFLRPLFEGGTPDNRDNPDNLTGYRDADNLLKATWDPDPEITPEERLNRYLAAQVKI